MKAFVCVVSALLLSGVLVQAGEMIKRPLWTNEEGEVVESWVFQSGQTSCGPSRSYSYPYYGRHIHPYSVLTSSGIHTTKVVPVNRLRYYPPHPRHVLLRPPVIVKPITVIPSRHIQIILR